MSAVLGVALLAGLTGCSVRTGGITGISVDDAGHLTVVLAWCGRGPDVVIVYHDPVGPETNPAAVDAEYRPPALGGKGASFRFDAPSDGWTVVPKPLIPAPGVTYRVYGATHDNSSSTANVGFEAGDVAKLKPGLVLVQRYDEKKQDAVDVVMSLREFEREGQDPANCV
ncbi:hypothetical protein [Streptosporangium sp. 'caverna']|uniref:hypothetical protein n=1 Tax=Streptosporangium sp. 'caverna' TaxID=2202249 RepID=UPI000D7D4CD3|nr:hypothetical protein [Streptosporangium sp. 'caverna']AWS46862.1 hypothetical protein DKM19_41785 [Streptosporangium sp. 'caverna']